MLWSCIGFDVFAPEPSRSSNTSFSDSVFATPRTSGLPFASAMFSTLIARKSENSIVSPSLPGICSGAVLPIVPFTAKDFALSPVIG
ncbi:hypothetical protein BamIOP4010DRAFT_3786 [Burkholderia ambifaria IOP40-10]|uniref:Uncharacterized protein n=1 Tax=Burkholderia ambifaria IOP40-10 TaxID=396596 RepID=B1FIC6_9BURK|nr:hypothetical protein BamIOP4010DRAFT_3786 [Burkholderia ambifaria IOP40-10]